MKSIRSGVLRVFFALLLTLLLLILSQAVQAAGEKHLYSSQEHTG